jgi:hypothetical protein
MQKELIPRLLDWGGSLEKKKKGHAHVCNRMNRCLTFRVLTLSFVFLCLAVGPSTVAVHAQEAATNQIVTSAELTIKVLEGEDGVNIVQKKRAVRPIVEVTDRNNLPVAGATVLFTLPQSGASAVFGRGAKVFSIVTNAAGRAAVRSMTPVGTGSFNIGVSATFQGQAVTATIAQTNFATAEAAEAAGVAGAVGAAGGAVGITAGLRNPGIVAAVRAFLGLSGEGTTETFVPGSYWLSVNEAKGYGLYSYILFSSPPTGTAIERYRSLIMAYLNVFVEERSFFGKVPKELLNITYLPLLPTKKTAMSENVADWVLANYDYARAIILLKRAEVPTSSGPFIVSSLTPLGHDKELPRIVFTQDLAWVPPDLMRLYLKEFDRQTSQETSWTERRVESMMLSLRTAIGIVANEQRITTPALIDFMRVVPRHK